MDSPCSQASTKEKLAWPNWALLSACSVYRLYTHKTIHKYQYNMCEVKCPHRAPTGLVQFGLVGEFVVGVV